MEVDGHSGAAESHDGGICTGESYKSVVKLTFFKGASLKDPARLFNSSLDGNVRRAIDIHEDEEIDANAFKALIRAAVALKAACIALEVKARHLGFAATLLALATPSLAHRLNEYLQATTIGLERQRLTVSFRFTPGVDIVRNVVAAIDRDGDGVSLNRAAGLRGTRARRCPAERRRSDAAASAGVVVVRVD